MTRKQLLKATSLMAILVMVALLAGCGGGGSAAKRLTGLAPDAVVQAFFDAAKNNRLNEAALYVTPDSRRDTRALIDFLSGQNGLAELKQANLVKVTKVAEQGNYAVVLATLQTEPNSFKLSVKPVGLEKIDGEWYIVDFNNIYENAKYQVLAQLLKNI
ncbi:hypothetical protein TcarDRAFT_1079 [Thermosinus carboxydivorans Nor1]|uniref:DUF4878 domain-containing protein n=1 Tax=Thermosinus carboxydivorans Nor1 TaxID=401526 RepID=A1HQU7_9FIRM|nr:hypothetical protein [Thermosinus carboxydivorans]EAX47657.1 hypothetical protein TcarDRAFT_1079 [Thermosinus carboxydivorans Nor1]